MPEFYELHDARFIQQGGATSAANAVAVATPPCPAGKLRTVIGAAYIPSAAETRTVWWTRGLVGGIGFPVNNPVSLALSASIPMAASGEGIELKLFPGEVLTANRDVATAASTMAIYFKFIETDLPYYSYEEPQKKVIRQIVRRGSGGALSGGSSSEGGAGSRPGGGRERVPEPI